MTPFLLFRPFLLFFSSSLLLFFHVPTANAQNNLKPLDIYCDPAANYTNTSTFRTNLNLLLSSLSSNSSLSQNRGFYNGKIGQDPNTVYGQILCRGDSESSECHDCINKASENILINCSNSRIAAIWYDTCQLHYSDTNFFKKSANPRLFYVWSMINITDPDLSSFKENLGKLMYELAGEIKAKPWLRNFATGEANYADLMMVYGLVQCVPDITATDCYTCLTDAIRRNIHACCANRTGGRVIGYVCGLRFETTDAFYNKSIVADPAPKDKVNIVLILVPAFTGVIILALMVALLRFSEKDKKAETVAQPDVKNETGEEEVINVETTAVAQPDVKKETGKKEKKKEEEINVET